MNNGKLNRKRKGTFAKKPVTYGKKVKIRARYDGTCAICGQGYGAGLEVLYDKSKSPGNKCSHISCYLREQKECED